MKKDKNKEKSAFVIMCFDQSLTIIYEKVIKTILEIHKIRCIRSDEMSTLGKIPEQIEESINDCDLIVCDLTYNNPNVFFELGIAHCLNKNIIHITQEPNNIPFDVKHTRMIIYQDTKTGLLDLRDELSKFIKTLFPDNQDYTQRKSKIDYNVSHDDIKEKRFALFSSTSHIKHYAIKFLGDCADTESFDVIERISGIETNPDILRDAFLALYKIDPIKAKQILLEKGLRWQIEYLVRERVVSILGNYVPDHDLIHQMKAQLDDSSWGVRKAACEVLGKWRISNNDVKIKLMSIMTDDIDQSVRFAAGEALEKISEKINEIKDENMLLTGTGAIALQ
jgi:hypothetical protein